MLIDNTTWEWLQEYRPACCAELRLQNVTEMEVAQLGHQVRVSFPQLKPRQGCLPIFDHDPAGQMSITIDWKNLKKEA